MALSLVGMLDGRLVGDIGEILVQAAYDLEIFDDLPNDYDGRTSDGRRVQIKPTMNNALTSPASHVPDCHLGIKIHRDVSFSEVFSGPGLVEWQVKGRIPPKTNLHTLNLTLNLGALKSLSKKVAAVERIPLRPNAMVLPSDLTTSVGGRLEIVRCNGRIVLRLNRIGVNGEV
jgi:hypothetical protein